MLINPDGRGLKGLLILSISKSYILFNAYAAEDNKPQEKAPIIIKNQLYEIYNVTLIAINEAHMLTINMPIKAKNLINFK